MKLLITLFFTLIAFCACTKNSDPKDNKYTGRWEARRENVIPNVTPPYRFFYDYIGPGNTIQFDDDSVTISMGGSISRQGKFTIQKDTCVSCYGTPKNLDKIVFDFTPYNTSQASFLDLQGDTLTRFLLSIPGVSGFVIKYVRIEQ